MTGFGIGDSIQQQLAQQWTTFAPNCGATQAVCAASQTRNADDSTLPAIDSGQLPPQKKDPA